LSASIKTLILAIVLLITVFLAYLITAGSPEVLLTLLVVIVAVMLTVIDARIGLFFIVFSMLLSPEFVLGYVSDRRLSLRFEDLIVPAVFFTYFAIIAVNKQTALIKRTPLNVPILIYLSACFLFTGRAILSGGINHIKAFFYILKYVEFFMIYFLTVNIVRTKSEVRKYLWAGLVTCLIVLAYAYTQISPGTRVSAPFQPEGSEPASLGGYLIIVLGVVTGLTAYSRNKTVIAGGAVFWALCITPFLHTYSRASYLGIIPMIVSLIILTRRKKIWMAGAFVILLILLPVILPQSVLDRINETFSPQKQSEFGRWRVNLDESTAARVETYQWVFSKRLPEKPLFGWGITGAGFIDGQYAMVAAELGLTGLVIFIWLLIRIFKTGWKLFRAGPDDWEKGIGLGYLAGVVGLFFHGITTSTFSIVRVMEPFWFLTGLVVCLELINMQEEISA